MSGRLRGLLRSIAVPARWSLRAYWGTAALLAVAGGIGVVAVLPVTTLHARLGVPLLRVVDLGLGRSSLATGPNELRAAALASLYQLLVFVAVGVLCVAVLSLLAVAFARGRARVTELTVRRAVGASRRLLLAAALIEGGIIGAVALAWGGAGGLAGARVALGAWPGPLLPSSGVGAAAFLPLPLVAGLVLLGVLLPLGAIRRRQPLAPRSARALELVVPAVQLGLSLTVLTGAALLAQRAARLRGGAGAAAASGRIFEITLTTRDTGRAGPRYAELLRRVGHVPGVAAVGLASPGTVVGLGQNDRVTTDCGQCAWGDIYVPFHPVYASQYLVSADTFRTLGLRVEAGRDFEEADDATAPPVAVVSRSLAAAHFQQQRAVGRRIQVGHAPARWYTVVGVVADQLPRGFGGGLQPAAAVYLSVLQHPVSGVELLVRGDGSPGVDGRIERQLRTALGGSYGATRRVSEASVLAAEAAPVRWFGRMFALEGWVMLAVAAIGTFIVLRLWVTSLLPELGVRRAVGARRRHLYGFVLARALAIALGGVAFGCWAGGIVWGSLTPVMAGLPAWDAGLAARFGVLLAATAVAGALVPAWEAARAVPARLVTGEG